MSGNSEDRPLREIIYLDLERVASYLSQMEGGLTDYLQRIRMEGGAETSRSWEFDAGKGILPIGFGLGSGSKAFVDTTILMQQKHHHHAALNVLEKALKDRNAIGSNQDDKPFVEHRGHPFFIDYEHLKEKLAKMGELQKTLEALSDLEKQETDQNSRSESKQARRGKTEEQKEKERIFKKTEKMFKDFSEVANAFGDRIDIYFRDIDAGGILERKNLLCPSDWLQTLYGSPSRLSTKIIALNTTGDIKRNEQPFSLPIESSDGNLTEIFAYIMNTYNKEVGRLFVPKTRTIIIPIAVYIEVDGHVK